PDRRLAGRLLRAVRVRLRRRLQRRGRAGTGEGHAGAHRRQREGGLVVGVILDDITAFKNSLTGGAFEALAAATGESLSIRWLGQNTKVELLEAWGGDSATKCQFSIRSPLLHDNVRGIRISNMFNPTLSGADGAPQVYLAPYW